MKFDSVRQAVELYCSKGFRVVPLYGVDADGICRCSNPECKLRDAGKHEPPETDGAWKDGRHFEPADFTEDRNVGIAMGPWGGEGWLVALDVDNHDDVNAFFYPGLPQTLTQLTPVGAHFIYQVPERCPLGNWVNVFKGNPGSMKLDIRYARGRCVVSPSRGSSTRGRGGYSWLHWERPAVLPQHAIDTILDLRRNNGLPVQDSWDRGHKQP